MPITYQPVQPKRSRRSRHCVRFCTNTRKLLDYRSKQCRSLSSTPSRVASMKLRSDWLRNPTEQRITGQTVPLNICKPSNLPDRLQSRPRRAALVRRDVTLRGREHVGGSRPRTARARVFGRAPAARGRAGRPICTGTCL